MKDKALNFDYICFSYVMGEKIVPSSWFSNLILKIILAVPTLVIFHKIMFFYPFTEQGLTDCKIHTNIEQSSVGYTNNVKCGNQKDIK